MASHLLRRLSSQGTVTNVAKGLNVAPTTTGLAIWWLRDPTGWNWMPRFHCRGLSGAHHEYRASFYRVGGQMKILLISLLRFFRFSASYRVGEEFRSACVRSSFQRRSKSLAEKRRPAFLPQEHQLMNKGEELPLCCMHSRGGTARLVKRTNSPKPLYGSCR